MALDYRNWRSQAITLYQDLLEEYRQHLDWMRQQELENGQRRDQQLVIGLLAISVYNSARAVMALYATDTGEASLVFVRSQFEQAAKADYFAANPNRARDFLDSEPFERYKLTIGYDIRRDLREQIIADCKTTVEQKPRLLNHQSKPSRGKLRPDFLAIREALKPPDMQELMKSNKWNLDLYVSVFLLGSLWIHGSINELRNYIGERTDGTVGLLPDRDLLGPPDYLMQSCAYLFGFIAKIADWFPGANRVQEINALYGRHQVLLEKMNASQPSSVLRVRTWCGA